MTDPSQQTAVERVSERMTVWLEAPDLVCLRPTGVTKVTDMQAISAYYERHIRAWPHVFIMIDYRENTGLEPEARKYAAKAYGWVPFRGTVFYGGSFAMRTIGQMVIRLINTVREIDNPLMFVKTEEEARSWIEKRRRDLAQSGVLPTKKTG